MEWRWCTVGEIADGNQSILKLLTHVCRVLGIDLDAVRLEESDDERLPSLPNDDSVSVDANYIEDSLEGNVEPYGWPEIQVGVVREAVAVAEALPGWYSF
jgi:hypothetical protein